jgi:prepilin-type N-terminal cleavage/methylation domain-containing protein
MTQRMRQIRTLSWSLTRPRCLRRAFTLIELVLVLLLLAILSTLATVSLASSFRDASLRSAVDQIAFADASSRALAKNSGRALDLTIHPESRTVARNGATLVALPSSIHIDEVLVAGGAGIRINSMGQSPTFAVRLHASHSHSAWILIAGLTGIRYETQNDSEIREIFAHLAPAENAPPSSNAH